MLKRHLRCGDEVAAPDIRRINAKIGGCDVDQALAEEIRLHASGTAVGSRGRLVRDMSVDRARKVRNPIRPRQKLPATRRRRAARAAGIGSDIDRDLATQADDDALPIAGDFQIAGGFAGMVGRQEVLAPVLDPFHGAIESARDGGDQEVLRVEFTANAEAASGIRYLHNDGALREIEHRRQHAAVEERHLGDAEHGHAFASASQTAASPRVSRGTAVCR